MEILMKRFKASWGMLFFFVLFAGACSTTGSKRVAHRHSLGNNLGKLNRFDIPVVVNDPVIAQIDYLLSDKIRFKRYLARSTRYEAWMKEILRQEGIPKDLFYLALIESGFSNQALSRARALGPWQFMRATGKLYGLKSNYWLDERKDPEKSTRAAARYLKKLYNDYGDWYLALAAYNAGEGKVNRAMQHSDSSDFWKLSAPGTHYLKEETKNYVPRFLAAAILAKFPEKFNIGSIDYETPIPFEEVIVDGSIDLQVAAKLVSADFEDLKYLNPELNQSITPPQNYSLRIPKGSKEKFMEGYASLDPTEREIQFIRHKVRSGDTPARIAKRYHISTKNLLATNAIQDKNGKLKVGSTVLIPISPSSPLTYASSQKEEGSYKVRRGDTLSSIAKREGMSVTALQNVNALKGYHLKVGQNLKVVRSVTSEEPVLLAYNETRRSRKGHMNGVEWLIRQDNEEAKTQEVSDVKEEEVEEEIIGQVSSRASKRSILNEKGLFLAQTPNVEENDLGESFTTKPPQPAEQVVVFPKNEMPQWVTYHVNKKDTLASIAKQFDVTVADLKKINSLEHGIKPGQKIYISLKPQEPSAETRGVAYVEDEVKKPAARKTKHIVQRGDTLIKVAKVYGVSVRDLKNWNQLSGNTLKVGKSLRLIPLPKSKTRVAATRALANPSSETAVAGQPASDEF